VVVFIGQARRFILAFLEMKLVCNVIECVCLHIFRTLFGSRFNLFFHKSKLGTGFRLKAADINVHVVNWATLIEVKSFRIHDVPVL
jgi:hypothetical protein